MHCAINAHFPLSQLVLQIYYYHYHYHYFFFIYLYISVAFFGFAFGSIEFLNIEKKMAGRFNENPFAEEAGVNPFAVHIYLSPIFFGFFLVISSIHCCIYVLFVMFYLSRGCYQK